MTLSDLVCHLSCFKGSQFVLAVMDLVTVDVVDVVESDIVKDVLVGHVCGRLSSHEDVCVVVLSEVIFIFELKLNAWCFFL